MAFITLSGTLLDPNGDLAVGDQIRFTHKSTTGKTVEGAVSIITINPAGTYSLPLQYGLVLVEYKDVRTQQFKNLGVATVNSTNPATSIPELLNALVPVSSADLIQFQAILANAVTAQAAAENAATTAEAFAYQLTTTDLIASTATFTANTNIPTSGFTTSGDGGNGNWKQNGVTGQTPSKTPAQLGDALLNDGNGNQWGLVLFANIDAAAVGVAYGEQTDQSVKVQGLINNIRKKLNGGSITISGQIWVSQTVFVWERVFLKGTNGMVINWYQSDGTYDAKGSGFRLLPSSNVDVIKLAISGNEAQGSTIPTESNVARRHGGGLSSLYIDGYRSESNNLTSVNLNNSGRALVLRGVNVVEVNDIVVSRSAQDNFVCESNGSSDGQCNNIYANRIYSQGAKENGFDVSGGDSEFGFLWASQNGGNGITSAMGSSTWTAITSNDNSNNGFYVGAEDQTINGLHTYHNRKNGLIVDDEGCSLVAVKARHNGMNSSFSGTDRCGIVLTANAANYVISGCTSYDDGYRGDPINLTQQYGFRLLNSGNNGVWGANFAYDNQNEDYSFQSTQDMTVHNGMTSTFSHPGFTASSSINMDGSQIKKIRALSFDTPKAITSIISNDLSSGADTLLTINISSNETINTITSTIDGLATVKVRNISSGNITFTNNATIKNKSGSNLTLTSQQAVTYQEFSNGIFYEV